MPRCMTPDFETQELLVMIKSINVLLFIVTRVGSMISCFKEREEHKSLILEEEHTLKACYN